MEFLTKKLFKKKNVTYSIDRRAVEQFNKTSKIRGHQKGEVIEKSMMAYINNKNLSDTLDTKLIKQVKQSIWNKKERNKLLFYYFKEYLINQNIYPKKTSYDDFEIDLIYFLIEDFGRYISRNHKDTIDNIYIMCAELYEELTGLSDYFIYLEYQHLHIFKENFKEDYLINE